jgi:uncharacterized membrane protein YkoI
MSLTISALRRPLAVTAVTAVLFSVVACSGSADPTSAPPPASSPSVSESAAEPTPTATPSTSPTATPSESSSAPPATNPDGNDALLAAGALGAQEVSSGTVVSVEAERDGWEVHVVSDSGDEQQLRTDASGKRLASGPTDDRPDAEDRAENQQFAQAETNYKRAVKAVEADVDGGEIRELSLDRDNGRTVWEADVLVGSQQRQVQVDADNGKILSNRVDD